MKHVEKGGTLREGVVEDSARRKTKHTHHKPLNTGRRGGEIERGKWKVWPSWVVTLWTEKGGPE